ncbi:type II toxin-antitoxin system RelE/ParE family toxin [Photobacterium damselae subsp. damselae]|uniref:Type II toxin-antitoxin system RelE/ParE family toxin n=2 Tax=Photobacterium damselae TaxID=38293 RepID=A0A850QXT1_PHODD|nr:type II toxin-antitoxin system RelE/ParE family toxin [Photobacterium damselae]KAB1183014.1 type II toxin-antitoxin system RelE/ParE family toxin [Photobacterium damselae subsp. damselae]MCG3816993.1 type II toxin-antitoxin system RelE/ParE family toxin [Photobacterium damselae]NVP03452.1 type II toxin-antitoxin system RelE/ParE family toxin [Photobacterium damselae subsp. damselae]PSB87094.1 type II toxin-antitoxin system RelE/ParE family toxin [Photobacterium damselae subsp. damselae]PSB8
MIKTKLVSLSTFENTTFDLIDYFSQWNDENKVIERVENLIEQFESTVLVHPEMYPICQDIREFFGIVDYRIFKSDGLKIVYRYDASHDVIYVMLMLSDKQDMQKILIDYCIVHK